MYPPHFWNYCVARKNWDYLLRECNHLRRDKAKPGHEHPAEQTNGEV